MNLCPKCHIIYAGHGCPMCGRGKRKDKTKRKVKKKRPTNK